MTGTQPTQSWLRRRWPWLVAAGCLGLLVLAAVFVGVILLAVSTGMKSSDAYAQALEAAQEHPAIVEALGEPMEPGFLPGGSINVTGPTGQADLSIPIKGPKGSGTIYLSATKSAGIWQFSILEVAVEGREERIELLPRAIDGGG